MSQLPLDQGSRAHHVVVSSGLNTKWTFDIAFKVLALQERDTTFSQLIDLVMAIHLLTRQSCSRIAIYAMVRTQNS